MIIKSVKLVNFRNHSEYLLECKDSTSLILGENGCGKTSVLEAIYILTRGKSFRAVDAEILKRGEEFYRVEIEFCNGEKSIVTFDGKDKTFIILDKKTKRLPKKNKYPVVLFLPSDLNLVSSSPVRRREYFDRIFSQFNEKYSDDLLRYEKALKQRNELLKSDYLKPDMMFSWNILLAKYGAEIEHLRKQFIEEINKRITKVYRSIANNDDEVLIKLDSTTSEDSDEYLRSLEANFEKDRILGHTSFGVHRDDFVFLFNQNEADGSASRGEVRSIILALKFIEAEMILEKLSKRPIILLDDVFSELDDARRKCLVENFRDNQVIITSVEAFGS
ncbi:DNA replication and repair protein RecF [Candidatus Saccharibacteria bacterium]|nr:DNA replication and repair protein RecF [Candidatus Saccharibacteria bacterium]